jgi:hypothetical protein
MDIVDGSGKSSFWKGVKAILQPPGVATRRGTLQHIVLEGSNATKAFDEAGMFIGIQARSLHKEFDGAVIPYAIAATLEVAQTLRVNIYNAVRDEVVVRNQTRTRSQVRVGSRS